MHHNIHHTPEGVADRYLKQGDIAAAETYLDDALRSMAVSDKQLHHLSIKKATLPLYEIAHGTTGSEVYDDANDVYGFVGELIDRELNRTDRPPEEGHISELVFLALPLRQIAEPNLKPVVVPASRQDDINKGIDFIFTPPGSGVYGDGYPVQVKTWATRKDRSNYKNRPITLISMSDIDPHALEPDHPDSLAQSILRELRGKSTNDDIERLDAALQHIVDEIIANKKAASSVRMSQSALRLLSFDGPRSHLAA